jgi:hypothetical protein
MIWETTTVLLAVIVCLLVYTIRVLLQERLFWRGAYKTAADRAGNLLEQVHSDIDSMILDGHVTEDETFPPF